MGGMNVRDGAFRTSGCAERRIGDTDLPRDGIVLSCLGTRGADSVGIRGLARLDWYSEKFCDDLRLGIANAIGV